MNRMLKVFLGVGACALLTATACSSSDEARGDKAYERAAKLQSGHEKRMALKEAYLYYDKAVKANPDKINNRLRERYLDMAITRLQAFLEESGVNHGGIHIMMEDIEKFTTPEVSDNVRQRYAAFLVQRGDSSEARQKYIEALMYYDQGIEKAPDPTPFKAKRDGIIRGVAEENYNIGMIELTQGKANKEEAEHHFVRAEYYARVALYFDSTYADAQKLLDECRVLNRGTLNAFISVVTDYPDTPVFKKVNKFDILMAVTDFKNGTAIIHMYNYSYNPLRMDATHFSLIDVNGKEHKAQPAKLDPLILEFEKEATYTLRFPSAAKAKIKKLVYKNPGMSPPGHYSEKYFF